MAAVLITGASGLIGRRLVEAYVEGEDDVVGIGREVDLLGPGAWTSVLDVYRPAAVVHLAWSASALPDYRNHSDNWRWTESTIAGAALAAERGIRFLATGTSVDDVQAEDAYSQSKSAARDALADRIEARTVGWMRPFYVFDEERPSPAVLRAALEARRAGRPVGLSNPDARHDFVHARDVGTAIRTIVRADLMGAIDIGTGDLTSVAELVESYGCEWSREGAPQPVAANNAAADARPLLAAGWRPIVTAARLGRNG